MGKEIYFPNRDCRKTYRENETLKGNCDGQSPQDGNLRPKTGSESPDLDADSRKWAELCPNFHIIRPKRRVTLRKVPAIGQ